MNIRKINSATTGGAAGKKKGGESVARRKRLPVKLKSSPAKAESA